MKKNLAITNILPITANDIIDEIHKEKTPKKSPPPNLLALIVEKQYPEESAMNHELAINSTPLQAKSNDKKNTNKKKEKKRKRTNKNEQTQKRLSSHQKTNIPVITISPGFNLLLEIGKRHYPELHNHDN